MNFTELPIPLSVQTGIRDCGFVECTPIQALTLPLALQGTDVSGQAQTGTGKTAAFLIALFARLLEKPPATYKKDHQICLPRALVIAPTRELVVQIEKEAQRLGRYTGLRMLAVFGGMGYELQKRALFKNPDILIGTPGRLIDFMKQQLFSLAQVEVLVIDEADRMFDMGFIVDLRFMLHRLPTVENRLSMLFSATLSLRARELSYEFMNQPHFLAPNEGVKTADNIQQGLYHVSQRDKPGFLVGFLLDVLQQQENLREKGRILIFVNTKRVGEQLLDLLMFHNVGVGYLSGDVQQAKRLRVLDGFGKGTISVLIATDVAGRGLHIENVTHVINYDLPEDPENYVHRIGRTARAGKGGDAISFVDEDGVYRLGNIEALIGLSIPVLWAQDDFYVQANLPKRRGDSSARSFRGHRERANLPREIKKRGRSPVGAAEESSSTHRHQNAAALEDGATPKAEMTKVTRVRHHHHDESSSGSTVDGLHPQHDATIKPRRRRNPRAVSSTPTP